jgi:hypothetical protein
MKSFTTSILNRIAHQMARNFSRDRGLHQRHQEDLA